MGLWQPNNTKKKRFEHSNENIDRINYFVGNVRSHYVEMLHKVLKFLMEDSIRNGCSHSDRIGDRIFLTE
jgi:hypothetical protein